MFRIWTPTNNPTFLLKLKILFAVLTLISSFIYYQITIISETNDSLSLLNGFVPAHINKLRDNQHTNLNLKVFKLEFKSTKAHKQHKDAASSKTVADKHLEKVDKEKKAANDELTKAQGKLTKAQGKLKEKQDDFKKNISTSKDNEDKEAKKATKATKATNAKNKMLAELELLKKKFNDDVGVHKDTPAAEKKQRRHGQLHGRRRRHALAWSCWRCARCCC